MLKGTLRKLFFLRNRSTTTRPLPGGTTTIPSPEPPSLPILAVDAEPGRSPTETDREAPPRRRRRRGGGRRHTVADRRSRPPPVGHVEPLPPGVVPHAFQALGVDDVGLAAVAALGFTEPTPIQTAALPLLLAGKDVVGLAQTGSGKTLAFALPMARLVDPSHAAVQAIVLVPTRELAQQVRDVVTHLGTWYGFRTHGLIGGSRVKTDFDALAAGVHVVVGTPGRVIDHLDRGTLRLEGVKFAVLDEADQMLDIGFARAIDRILRTTPRDRQTALFSATMPLSIARLVHRYLRSAEQVSVVPEQPTVDTVKQYYCEVQERDKLLALRYLYEQVGLGRSLIFRRTKVGVDRLAAQLQSAGVHALAIHGDLSQAVRDRVMADFRSGNLDFLVATNVAARGLDVPDIKHVINFDVPDTPEEYIHRIGRTARAGREGTAVTLVTPWDLDQWDAVREAVGGIELLPLPAQWD